MSKYAAELKKVPQVSRKIVREMRDKFRKPLKLSSDQLKLETEQEIRKEIDALEVRLQSVERVIEAIMRSPPPTTWQEARNNLMMRSRQKELRRLWSFQLVQLKKKLPDQTN